MPCLAQWRVSSWSADRSIPHTATTTLFVCLKEGYCGFAPNAQGRLFKSGKILRALPMMAWSCRQLAIAQSAHLAAQCLLGYRPPAPEAAPWPVPSSGYASPHLRPALAKEVIMHLQSTQTTQWGPVNAATLRARYPLGHVRQRPSVDYSGMVSS